MKDILKHVSNWKDIDIWIFSTITNKGRYVGALTHWGRDKTAAISQTTLSIAFSWMKMLEFSIKFSLKFVPKGPIDNIPALVQIMAWRRPGDKPLSEPVMTTDAYMHHSASMSWTLHIHNRTWKAGSGHHCASRWPGTEWCQAISRYNGDYKANSFQSFLKVLVVFNTWTDDIIENKR